MKKLYILTFLASFLCASICAAQEETPKTVPPKKVEMDTNYDGKADRVELYDQSGDIVRLESDSNGDGAIDEWMTFDKGKPVKKEKDTNADGKPDVWIEY